MGDLLANLAFGFGVAFSPQILWYCFVGVTVGTVIGVLPGIGSTATLSMLLPLTYHLPPTAAIVMLAGIYYGANYGGSTASILLNLPGTPSSAVTCLDGYPMARQGRAGVALMMTTVASFVGSTLTVFLVIAFAPPLAEIALNFGAPEYFSVMMLGLFAAATLGIGSPVKGVVMVVFGIILGLIGTDTNSGTLRLTFGMRNLYEGLSLVALALGFFGIAELAANSGRGGDSQREHRSVPWRSLIPTRGDLTQSIMPMLRGTGIGAWFGILPGTGSSIAAFMSYAVEKRIARDPSRFGRGAIEGITAPEAANNAASQAAFIPTLTLGIPGDAQMALLLGALMIHGIVPGPMTMTTHPDLFWGLIASFWIGNVMLFVLNAPMVGLWVRLLLVPYRYLFPTILMFISVGVFSINSNVLDIFVVMAAGAVGYGMRLLGFNPAPAILGFILGPLLEENFRRSLVLSGGDLLIFVERPVSAGFIGVTCLLLLFALRPLVRRRLA
jgi:TctA family transporter